MSLLILIIVYMLAISGFLLALFLALEVAAAIFSRAEKFRPTEDVAGSIKVIVPAHNEAANIASTLDNICAQLRGADSVLVVADNCTDNTALLARDAGADVIERNDLERRGKGYALQFALDHLRASPPEIVIFTDADCLFAPGALKRIASVAAHEGRPAQALYLMKAPKGANARLKAAEFAWAFMNNVRMRGLQQLFDVTRFTGAGLAAPWQLLENVQMGSGEIVEDLSLTMQLIRKDAAPLLVADAIIESEFPVEEAALTRQSARWSIGSLRYGARASVRALIEGVKRERAQQIGAAIDLMVPPLTIFVGALMAVALASALCWLLFGASGAFGLAFSALLLTSGSIAGAWFKFGREILPVSEMRGLASFLISKLSVFGAKGRESAKRWTPTRSDSEKDGL
ncbi:glycosyltransferase family 2 protein [Hyphococcus sp.]|uniref:glycosyltransferase family 2 protein n=1 Tax=Hyphococcus sp. TaxID=2038636 RepID=UPI00208B1BF0|nr:MAG: glycosyl transferase [Marinicaulis sp.]